MDDCRAETPALEFRRHDQLPCATCPQGGEILQDGQRTSAQGNGVATIQDNLGGDAIEDENHGHGCGRGCQDRGVDRTRVVRCQGGDVRHSLSVRQVVPGGEEALEAARPVHQDDAGAVFQVGDERDGAILTARGIAEGEECAPTRRGISTAGKSGQGRWHGGQIGCENTAAAAAAAGEGHECRPRARHGRGEAEGCEVASIRRRGAGRGHSGGHHAGIKNEDAVAGGGASQRRGEEQSVICACRRHPSQGAELPSLGGGVSLGQFQGGAGALAGTHITDSRAGTTQVGGNPDHSRDRRCGGAGQAGQNLSAQEGVAGGQESPGGVSRRGEIEGLATVARGEGGDEGGLAGSVQCRAGSAESSAQEPAPARYQLAGPSRPGSGCCVGQQPLAGHFSSCSGQEVQHAVPTAHGVTQIHEDASTRRCVSRGHQNRGGCIGAGLHEDVWGSPGR